MFSRLFAIALLLAAVGLGALPRGAQAADAQVIVKLRAEGAGQVLDADGERQRFQGRLDGVARRQSLPTLRGGHTAIGSDQRVVRASGMDARTLAERLARDPGVAYAVPDRRVRRAAVPNDPLFAVGGGSGPAAGQWYLKTPTTEFVSAINAQGAWDLSTGSTSVIVAVLDTGIRADHPDLAVAGKIVPGYDFVSGGNNNDGGLRDSDPSDPGDWVERADITNRVVDSDCIVEDSSWHGTDVAGIIGAATDNGIGIASVGRNVKLMNLRVLGKCNGRQSDIVAAMNWAAGIAVAGLPTNPNPVRVINLSLGSEGDCDKAYQDAVNAVTARGVVVVASAGNSAGQAMGSPANCSGVIGVAGLRHIGTKVGFSDLGSNVTISAPGGNCVNDTDLNPLLPCLYPIVTTTNSGRTTPVLADPAYSDAFNATVGTSFAAPQVAGAVALMLSVQPALTPAAVRSMLTASARPFPTTGAAGGTAQCMAPQVGVRQIECYCTTATCGAGMLDVQAAVLAAQSVQLRITVSPMNPEPGLPLTLSAADTQVAVGRTISFVSWTLVDGGGIVSSLGSGTNTPTISVTPSAAGSFTVRLSVTDSAGATATTQRSIAVIAPIVPVPPPSGGGGGGGGGGALGGAWLALLAVAVVAARRLDRRA